MKRVEHELLLCIARRDLKELGTAELQRLLATQINWPYLVTTAREHGLIPLLHRHLAAFVSCVPHGEFENLHQESLENCRSILHLLGRLQKIIASFQKEGIPALVFKGPILSEQAYGENSLRQAGDLDVLIRQNDFDRAKAVLETLGYQMTPPLNLTQQRAHLNFHCEIQFTRDNGFTIVDLHWSVTPKTFPFELHTDDLFARSQQVTIGSQTIDTFGEEDLILFLSMHGAKHYWLRLEWITALAELIRSREDVDWSTLVNRARQTRGTKMLALGVILAKRLCDVEIPEAVLKEIDSTGSMSKVADEALATIFDSRDADYLSINAARKNVQIMDRKRDALAAAFRATFVPTISDWESVSLPTRLHPLYYVVRPLRLAKSYAGLISQRLFRSADRPSKSVEEQLSGGLN